MGVGEGKAKRGAPAGETERGWRRWGKERQPPQARRGFSARVWSGRNLY